MKHRLAGLALFVVALCAPLTACGSENTPKTPSTTVSSTPTTADPTAEAYDKAVAAWTEYQRVSEPIWAAGKVTPQAKKIFTKYWVDPASQLDTLVNMGNGEIQIKGIPKVYKTTPAKVTTTQAEFVQCVDYNTQRYFQNGKDVDEPTKFHQPQRIEMTLTTDGWKIQKLHAGDGTKRCKP